MLAAGVGLGFGVLWGDHLSGQATWPRLLWVSLGLAVVALMGALVRTARPAPANGAVLVVPWRWPADRLYGLVALNLAIAGGIAVGFQPAS